MFGAIVVIFGGEKIGRQRALVLGGCIVVVGTILQASSYSRAQFIVARIVTGLGNGINTSTLGIYQSETCSAESRGKLVTVEGIQAICGVVRLISVTNHKPSTLTTAADDRILARFRPELHNHHSPMARTSCFSGSICDCNGGNGFDSARDTALADLERPR